MILVVLDNQNTKNEVTKICNEPGIHHIFVAFSECMNFQIEGSLKKIQIFIYPVKQIQMHTALHMNKHKSSKSEQVS